MELKLYITSSAFCRVYILPYHSFLLCRLSLQPPAPGGSVYLHEDTSEEYTQRVIPIFLTVKLCPGIQILSQPIAWSGKQIPGCSIPAGAKQIICIFSQSPFTFKLQRAHCFIHSSEAKGEVSHSGRYFGPEPNFSAQHKESL